MTDLLNDRLPPQNIEAEQAVLGAIFLQPSALTLASEVLIPDDFYRMSHQKSIMRCWCSVTEVNRLI